MFSSLFFFLFYLRREEAKTSSALSPIRHGSHLDLRPKSGLRKRDSREFVGGSGDAAMGYDGGSRGGGIVAAGVMMDGAGSSSFSPKAVDEGQLSRGLDESGFESYFRVVFTLVVADSFF